MKERFQRFFYGRQGMDEFSKALFWSGLASMLLSALLRGLLNGVLSGIFSWLGLFQIVFCFVRAFSRRLDQRNAENASYLGWIAGQNRKFAAYKDRRSQRRDFKFFKCPGCGAMLRVPRGKGKLHIKCKCGYMLYRRT